MVDRQLRSRQGESKHRRPAAPSRERSPHEMSQVERVTWLQRVAGKPRRRPFAAAAVRRAGSTPIVVPPGLLSDNCQRWVRRVIATYHRMGARSTEL
jgi:hypothetical protein